MGSFYTNFEVVGGDSAEVLRVAKELGRRAYVISDKNGDALLFDSDCDEQDVTEIRAGLEASWQAGFICRCWPASTMMMTICCFGFFGLATSLATNHVCKRSLLAGRFREFVAACYPTRSSLPYSLGLFSFFRCFDICFWPRSQDFLRFAPVLVTDTCQRTECVLPDLATMTSKWPNTARVRVKTIGR